jgi:hypothetical protein
MVVVALKASAFSSALFYIAFYTCSALSIAASLLTYETRIALPIACCLFTFVAEAEEKALI